MNRSTLTQRSRQTSGLTSMKRDSLERLAFSVAQRLRAGLGHPATAHERASGYGTVCMTGHPVLGSLWLQCVEGPPERALVEAERDSAAWGAWNPPGRRAAANATPHLAPLHHRAIRPAMRRAREPQSGLPWLPLIFYRDKNTTTHLMTRLWVLDELRWISQSDSEDAPRTLLDTMLARLNHGNMPVVLRLVDLVHLLKRVIENEGHTPC